MSVHPPPKAEVRGSRLECRVVEPWSTIRGFFTQSVLRFITFFQLTSLEKHIIMLHC